MRQNARVDNLQDRDREESYFDDDDDEDGGEVEDMDSDRGVTNAQRAMTAQERLRARALAALAK